MGLYVFQHRRPVNEHEDDEEIAKITNGVEVARLSPQSLLKPYLMARMEDTDNRPCLFSTFIGRSVDLILEHRAEYTNLERRQMFVDMVAAFNDDLIGSYCSDIFSTLFDSQGLNYWLPLFNTASLTVYPNPEHNLRMFCLFRLAHRSAQLQGCEVSATQQNMIIDLLADPPSTPEYKRLFLVDAFNLAMSSRNEQVLDAFLASETGKLLSDLTVSERIWCAAKQGKRALTVISLKRAFVDYDVHNKKVVQLADLILQGLVESGQAAHFGCTVASQLIRCKYVTDIIELCRNMDLEDCTEIWSRAHAANMLIWEQGHK